MKAPDIMINGACYCSEAKMESLDDSILKPKKQKHSKVKRKRKEESDDNELW